MPFRSRSARPDRAEAAARERLAKVGHKLGLEPRGGSPSAPSWLPMPMFGGDRLAVRAALRGWSNGLDVQAVDLTVARRDRLVRHACALSRIAANVPRLSVDPVRAAPGSTAGAGIATIDPEGLRFEREYRTCAVDRAFASRFLGLSTIRWFMDRPHPRLHFVAEGPNIGCYAVTTPDDRPMPVGLGELLPLLVPSLAGFATRLMAVAFPAGDSSSYSAT
jgi:hypothetical protein